MNIETMIALKDCTENKKIILFGTGSAAEKLWYWLDFLGAADEIIYCVDNNEGKWGSMFLSRYEIKNPENIRKEDVGKTVVLVASCYYEEILGQVSEWGNYSVYNAYPNCDWALKELIDIYKDRKILLLADDKRSIQDLMQFAQIMESKLDVAVITRDEICQYPLNEFADKIFWITSKNHMAIENELEKMGYRANADYYSIVPFVFPDYCYLSEGSDNWIYDDWEMGCKDNMEDYFCPMPFERLYLYSTTAHICGPHPSNYVSVGNIQKVEDLDKLWNGPMAKTYREAVLSGSFFFCHNKRCRYMYSGLLQKRADVTDPFYRQIIDNNLLQIEGGPSYLNIGIDSRCNLQCKMCGAKNVEKPEETKERLKEIVKKLKQYNFTNLRTLFIAGSGEVFFNPIYSEVLNNLDQFHMPNLEKIILKTNGVLLDRHVELIHKLSKKCRVFVSLSVDGIRPETYRMIRRKSNYDRVYQNMALLSDLKEKHIVKEIEYSFCIQRDNFRELPDFIETAIKYNADTVLLQKVMGQKKSNSVQSEDNVYHNIFVNLVNKAYKMAKNAGLKVSAEALMKFIDD